MNKSELENLRSSIELHNIINTYIPWTKSALDPTTIKIILNDILINNRSVIVECGSGISTLFIGSILNQHSLTGCKVYSIDHNKEWIDIINRYINILGIKDYVELIHAPLKPFENEFKNVSWYDTTILSNKLGSITINQLIVDGPPAYLKEIEFSRFPAVPFFKSKLSEEFIIFLDDTDRKGERSILKKWSSSLGIEFNEISKNLSIGVKGDIFNIV